MSTIVKILVLSVVISALIRYGLPTVVDLEQFSTIDQDRIAIAILTLIPMIFLGWMWHGSGEK